MYRTALIVTALTLAGCQKVQCPEPLYEGKASDEAYLSLLDAEARATRDDSKATIFSKPTDGQQFAANDTPIFAWTSGLMAVAPKPLLPREPTFRVMDFIYSSAWAHLAPVTGPIYWLRFGEKGQACPALELLTTKTDFQANSAAWTSLQGKTLELRSIATYLQENRVTEGPFLPSKDISISVAK